MLITAKFTTRCKTCNKIINIGERISWERKSLTVRHALCSDEGKATQIGVAESWATDAPNLDIPCPTGLAYLPYQKAGIAYALSRRGTLIGDDMGLGKTIQAVGYINSKITVKQPHVQVYIVCPASLKINWYLELRKWLVSPLTFGIANGTHTAHNIVITNYESLDKLLPRDLELLILDEAQYIKNPESKRAKLVKQIGKRSHHIIALSGTPIPNRPKELWPILQILNPKTWDPPGIIKGKNVKEGEGAGFGRFARRYCDAKEKIIGSFKHPITGAKILKKAWSFDGASNLPELQERLRTTVMVRRLKKDVLSELPPKRRQVIVLPANATSDGELLDLFDIHEWPNDLDECVKMIKADLPKFAEFSKVRHEQALRKAPWVVEHVMCAMGSSEKIILFAHHIDVLECFHGALEEFKPILYTGETDPKDRQGLVNQFQNDSTRRVFIGSLKAAGVGLTLTAASHVVFGEGDFTPSVMTQAEDRAHRIGQRNAVLVQHLVQDKTLDGHLMQLVVQKQENLDLALDRETLK